MHGVIAAIAGFTVMIIALLAAWRVTMRALGTGHLDKIIVSRDWLIHHRENDQP